MQRKGCKSDIVSAGGLFFKELAYAAGKDKRTSRFKTVRHTGFKTLIRRNTAAHYTGGRRNGRTPCEQFGRGGIDGRLAQGIRQSARRFDLGCEPSVLRS